MKQLIKHIFSAILMLGLQVPFAHALVPEISIPQYALKEETRLLSESEIEELKAYAKDIKRDLIDIVSESNTMPRGEAIFYLTEELKKIVQNYKGRANSFVRFTINRSLILNQIIIDEDQSNENVSKNAQLRFLKQSIKLCLLYTEFDFGRYQEFNLKTYARFGADYYSLLVELSKSIIDASAQYKILIASLEFLQWDLYREVDNINEAPLITKIYHFLKRQKTTGHKSDLEYVQEIRQVKKFISTLSVRPYLNSVDSHEVEEKVKEALLKNKSVDLNSSFQAGEEIILADGNYENIRLMTEHPVIYEGPFISPQSLSHVVIIKEQKKKTVISSLEMFRQKGCLLENRLCVGEPIVSPFSGGGATIIGVQSFGSRILARTDTGKYFAAYAGGVYRRTGCSEKINACVGQKVVMLDGDKYKVKIITAINEDSRYGLFLIGDSFYDDKYEFASAQMFLGKL